MVRKKHKSKRVSLGLKYKIEKKCKEFKKKANKMAKKNQLKGIKAPKKKNPGIPNAWPFKAELLLETERKRIREDAAIEKAKEEKKERRRDRRQMYRDMKEEEDAKKEAEDEENEEVQEETVLTEVQLQVNAEIQRLSANVQQVQKLQETVDASDILLCVLDARDPMGSRLLALERDIAARGKKLILVLNKVAMVPTDILESWTKYLGEDHPVVLIESTVNISSLEYYKLRNGAVDSILQLVKAYINPKMSSAKVPTVGIFGYDHVGAQTVLEAMEGKFVHMADYEEPVETMHSDTPDARIRVLNYTAEIPNSYLEGASAVQARIFSARGRSDDPVEGVTDVMECCAKEQLMELYSLPHFADTEEFLDGFARKIEGDKQISSGEGDLKNFRGKGGKSKDGHKAKRAAKLKERSRLLKKGVVDVAATAAVLLSGWCHGRFNFYSTLPTQKKGKGKSDDAKTGHSWQATSKEFASGKLKDQPCAKDPLDLAKALGKVHALLPEMYLEIQGVEREGVDQRLVDMEAEVENLEEQLQILRTGEGEDEDEEMEEAEEEEDAEEEEEEVKEKPTKVQKKKEKKKGQSKAQQPLPEKKKARKGKKADADEGGAYDFNADFNYD
jgi:nuclear GTP-binding protein